MNEVHREGRLDTYNVVANICSEFFGLNVNEGRIEEVFRVGRGRNRPIVARFTSLYTKEFILEKNKKFERVTD